MWSCCGPVFTPDSQSPQPPPAHIPTTRSPTTQLTHVTQIIISMNNICVRNPSVTRVRPRFPLTPPHTPVRTRAPSVAECAYGRPLELDRNIFMGETEKQYVYVYGLNPEEGDSSEIEKQGLWVTGIDIYRHGGYEAMNMCTLV